MHKWFQVVKLYTMQAVNGKQKYSIHSVYKVVTIKSKPDQKGKQVWLKWFMFLDNEHYFWFSIPHYSEQFRTEILFRYWWNFELFKTMKYLCSSIILKPFFSN